MEPKTESQKSSKAVKISGQLKRSKFRINEFWFSEGDIPAKYPVNIFLPVGISKELGMEMAKKKADKKGWIKAELIFGFPEEEPKKSKDK